MDLKIAFMVLCFASLNYALQTESNGAKRELNYVDVVDNIEQSPTIAGRIVPFNRIIERIRLLGRSLFVRNINSRIVNYLADINLVQLSRDVEKLDNYGRSTAIAGRFELLNRVSDVISLLGRIILAGDRTNGIGNLVDDLTLNQLSDVDNLNNFRRALTNVERIALFNRILDKIRSVGRILLSYDRNNRIINLIINLRLNQLSRDVDSLSNTGLLGNNLLAGDLGNTGLLAANLLANDLGNSRLLGSDVLVGDGIVDVLNDDQIRNPVDIKINQRIKVKDTNDRTVQ